MVAIEVKGQREKEEVFFLVRKSFYDPTVRAETKKLSLAFLFGFSLPSFKIKQNKNKRTRNLKEWMKAKLELALMFVFDYLQEGNWE